MREILLFFVIFHATYCSCPDGLELVRDGQCRGYLTDVTVREDQASATAIAKCNEIQALPVIIHNDEEQFYWASHNSEQGDILLGLVCNSTNKHWEWADGSPLDYIYDYSMSEIRDDCNPNISWMMHSTYGEWTYYLDPSYETTFPIFCIASIHPPIDDTSCAFFKDDIEDGVCYQVGTAANDWQDAQMICRKLGADLASIHNLQENSFVRRLAVSKGAITGLFLGATIYGKEKTFGWIDGTTWDYDNFYPGFPRDGFGGCIVMDTSISTGQWMNIDCSEKMPVACIRKYSDTTDPVCSSETIKEGSIVTSPGFPYTASTPCDYYLMVDEGKKVEVELIFLEANSCCDSLVLYDGYVGGVVLANLTGEMSNVTYTTTSSHIMRVSWTPKGGVNVMGMAMTFRGV